MAGVEIVEVAPRDGLQAVKALIPTETKVALVEELAACGFPRVISLIRPQNIRSIRVAERLGEKLEGEITLMDRPALMYAISREQWTGGAIGSWDDRRWR